MTDIRDEADVPAQLDPASSFRRDIEQVINRHSRENGSDTPDFILAEFLAGCLANFDATVRRRESWYGRGKIEVKSKPTIAELEEILSQPDPVNIRIKPDGSIEAV